MALPLSFPLPLPPRLRATLLPLVAASSLSACTSVPPAQRQELRTHRVSQTTYRRIMQARPLSMRQVAELGQKGIPSSSIIYCIYRTRSRFVITASDRSWLRAHGVRDDVATFMGENRVITFF